MMIKKKYALIVPVIIFSSWMVLKNYKRVFPSQEMKDLRRIETSLNVPKTRQRKEDDRGCYVDGKGAQQYGRSIYQTFKDTETINTIKRVVENNNWMLINKSISDRRFHQELYWYNKDTEDNKQIFIIIESGLENTYPYALIISDKDKNQCF